MQRSLVVNVMVNLEQVIVVVDGRARDAGQQVVERLVLISRGWQEGNERRTKSAKPIRANNV